jgi:hypothetical protein
MAMDGRERITELLAGVVAEVRAALDAGGTPPEETSNAMMFYVLADHLLSVARTPEAALSPAALAGGLRQLKARCHDSLAPLRGPVAEALSEAENLDWDYRTA